MKKTQLFFSLLLTFMFFAASAFAQTSTTNWGSTTSGQPDGPYIFYTAEGVKVIEVSETGVVTQKLWAGATQLPSGTSFDVTSTVNDPTTGARSKFKVTIQDELSRPPGVAPAPDSLIVLSDVHAKWAPFISILKSQKVVDNNLNWAFGKNALMIIGDVSDRGDDATTCYWFIYEMQRQARLKGGQVYFNMGNHDEWRVKGTTTDLNAKYPRIATFVGTAARLGTSFSTFGTAWFSANSELGRFFRDGCEVIQIVGRDMYMHGGISPSVANLNLTIDQMNTQVAAQFLGTGRTGNVATILNTGTGTSNINTGGVLWYRAMVQTAAYDNTVLEPILTKFNVKRVIIGHCEIQASSGIQTGTNAALAYTRYDYRVVNVNVPTQTAYDNNAGRGALILKDGRTFRIFDNKGTAKPNEAIPTPAGFVITGPDSDGDGVPDDVDQCPDTPAGTPVDATGCPIVDSDGDGVPDSIDQCPDTPAGVPVDANGCPLNGDTPSVPPTYSTAGNDIWYYIQFNYNKLVIQNDGAEAITTIQTAVENNDAQLWKVEGTGTAVTRGECVVISNKANPDLKLRFKSVTGGQSGFYATAGAGSYPGDGTDANGNPALELNYQGSGYVTINARNTHYYIRPLADAAGSMIGRDGTDNPNPDKCKLNFILPEDMFKTEPPTPPSEFAGGDGSVTSPWLISTPAQLNAIRNHYTTGNSYELTQDIDLTEYLASGAGFTAWGASGWLPIGQAETDYFSGTLDGKGYTIKGLWINSAANNVGLFGSIRGAVQNLTIETDDAKGGVKGGTMVGILTGETTNDVSIIESVYTKGTVSGVASVGGLIGYSQSYGSAPTIRKSYSSATVTASTSRAGGLIGYINAGHVYDSYATGNVTAGKGTSDDYSHAGGLVGWLALGATNSSIDNSYATGNASGTGIRVGGLIGAHNGIVTNSYASGTATTTSTAAETFIGGLVGSTGGPISGGGYNSATGLPAYGGVGTDKTPNLTNVNPYTVAELKKQATYVDWDFTNIWKIDEDASYPYFKTGQVAPTTYTVTFVVNDGAAAITDAVVKLGATTNAAGNYVFTGLAAGTYNYTVTKAGFVTATGSVTVTGANVTKTVTLTVSGDYYYIQFVSTGLVIQSNGAEQATTVEVADGSDAQLWAIDYPGTAPVTNASGQIALITNKANPALNLRYLSTTAGVGSAFYATTSNGAYPSDTDVNGNSFIYQSGDYTFLSARNTLYKAYPKNGGGAGSIVYRSSSTAPEVDCNIVLEKVGGVGIHTPNTNKTLKASASNGILKVQGTIAGESVRVYTVTGQTVASQTATGSEQTIQLPAYGVYIVVAGTQAVKVLAGK